VILDGEDNLQVLRMGRWHRRQDQERGSGYRKAVVSERHGPFFKVIDSESQSQ
jgi:hypothetical protein